MDIPEDFDLARHKAVTQYLRQHGPTSLEWLAQQVRRSCRSRRKAQPSPVRSAVGRPHFWTQPPTVGYRVFVLAGPRPHLRGGRLA
jgi:hypothetical protein